MTLQRMIRSFALIGTAVSTLVLGLAPSAGAQHWKTDGSPADLDPPLEFSKLNIQTVDSVRVAAWYVPPAAGSRSPAPGIVVLPGDEDTMVQRLDIVEALSRRGYAVITYDARGRGASDPSAPPPAAYVTLGDLEDAHAALDILWMTRGVDTTRVAVYGEGRGAYTAFALARARPVLRALISVSCPVNIQELQVVYDRHGDGVKKEIPKDWQRKWEPDKVLNRWNGATLFIGGSRDLVTPAWMAETLYSKCTQTKELWIVEGADHGGERSPRAVAGATYWERVIGFLDRELSKPPHKDWPKR